MAVAVRRNGICRHASVVVGVRQVMMAGACILSKEEYARYGTPR